MLSGLHWRANRARRMFSFLGAEESVSFEVDCLLAHGIPHFCYQHSTFRHENYLKIKNTTNEPTFNEWQYKEEEEEGASIELRFESCKKSAPPPGVRRALFPSVTKMTA